MPRVSPRPWPPLSGTPEPIVAVLGLGSIGLRHARNLKELCARPIGFDPSPERRALLDGAVANRAAALDAADAVVIASPSGQHRDDLEAAIEAGCHVLVEKPLAHADAGLEAVLARAEAAGLTVFVAVNQRFNPAIEAGRARLRDGRLGEPLWARLLCASYLPDWRPQQDHRQGYAADPASGGVLFDVIHEFDLANHLLGPARTLSAAATRSGRLGIATEDIADVTLEHDGQLRSTLHLDYLTRPAQRITEIAGTEGLLRLDLRARRLERWSPDGAPAETEDFPGSVDDDYRAEMVAFLDCCRGEATPRCGGREGLAVLRQVLDARRLCGLETAGAAA